MKQRSKYFLGFVILIGLLFLFCCFSVIFCVIKGNSVNDSQKVEHVLGLVYLFIHMIILAIFFYLALKAYLTKSQLIEIFMTNENGTKNKKSYRKSLVFATFGVIFAIYFGILSFGGQIPLSFFSPGLKIALMNVGITVFSVSIYLACFSPKVKETDVKPIK